MKKIGILTWHDHNNFGGALQTYALISTLKELDCDVHVINYHKIKQTNIVFMLKFVVSKTLSQIINCKELYAPFLEFYNDYYNLTKEITDNNTAQLNNLGFDAIIYGSDQIWAPNVFNPIYMGNNYKGKKISYAASIGLEEIPHSMEPIYKQLLEDFSFISVREEQGKYILKNQCKIDSQLVLDPTLLRKKEEYITFEKSPYSAVDKHYAFCYFLNEHHAYKETVEAIAKERNISLYGISKNRDDESWITFLDKIGPREFVWLINNADYVFTDSYHGSIFSLLFHKKGLSFERFKNNDEINQNSRIDQLFRYFPVEKEISSNLSYYDFSKVNFNIAEQNIASYKKKSIDYLCEALDYDVLP